MKLAALLAGLEGVTVLRGTPDVEVTAVSDDSRTVRSGALFVAIAGTAHDGRRFIDDAAAKGAAVLVAAEDEPRFPGTVVLARNPRWTLGELAARFDGSAAALTLNAVTGTNGKTTTTYLLEAMLEAAGRRTGVIGTITYRLRGGAGPAISRPAPLTTPNAVLLHQTFREMREAGAQDLVLEASSIALEQGRLAGCRFRVAGFTNLTQDHLDYHGTMARYAEAKQILFDRLLDAQDGVAVLPIDQDEGRRLYAHLGGRRLSVSVKRDVRADVTVQRVGLDVRGTKATFATPLGTLDVETPLVGSYNLANLTLAVGMGIGRGLSAEAIVRGAAATEGVPGRLERVANDAGVLCVVDYAHTPDGIARVIEAVRPFVEREGRLIIVFGCGGDRDRTKRPLMGEIAMRTADLVMITSDNPRTEDPAQIVDMVAEGAARAGGTPLDAASWAAARHGYHVEVDRRGAIALAVGASRPGDVLVLAGKGHEDYQIVGTTKHPFDDRDEARRAFARRGGIA